MSTFDATFARECGLALDESTASMQDLHDIQLCRMREDFESRQRQCSNAMYLAQTREREAVEHLESAENKCFWLLMLACAGWALALTFGGMAAGKL